ncbi:MAG: hypothetical protein ACYTEL_02320 [Planctomycetota bacterium]
MRRKQLLTVFGLAAIMAVPAQATQFAVTTEIGHQGQPAVWDQWVAWCDIPQGGRQGNIYIKNLDSAEKIQVTSLGKARAPAIDAGLVVWADDRNGDYDIFGYDLSERTEYGIYVAPGDQVDPAIHGDTVVWRSGAYPLWPEVWMYSISQDTAWLVSSSTANKWKPDVYGDIVVWGDYRDGNWDIYAYDAEAGTEFLIAGGTNYQRGAAIWGTIVVYENTERPDGPSTIGVYDLITGEHVYISVPNMVDWLDVDGPILVWGDYGKGTDTDIYGYDLSTGEEFAICALPGWQYRPRIYENTVVWSSDANEDEPFGYYQRDIHGVWIPEDGPPDTVPPLAPSALVSPVQTTSSISLSWQAPSAAGDRDLASAYRVYRGSIYVGQVVEPVFVDTGLNPASPYEYEVYSIDDVGNRSESAAIGTFWTLASDTAAPTVIEVRAAESLVDVSFDEPLDRLSAESVANYTIDGDIYITSAALSSDLLAVKLETSSHSSGVSYTLTIVGIEDLAGNPMAETQLEYGRASNPSPSDGELGVLPEVILSWVPPFFAGSHNVYFGTDFDDVNQGAGGTFMGSQEASMYRPEYGLDIGTTYYWRIDEVYNTTIYKGNVWMFIVAELVIDDFESYDQDYNRIYYAWEDGYVHGNGSYIQLGTVPFSPAHSGEQSMLCVYDNSYNFGAGFLSEVVLPFTSSLNWAHLGPSQLVLYICGAPGNDAGFTEEPYVGLRDTSGGYDEVRYLDTGGDLGSLQHEEWYKWQSDLEEFEAVDLTCVERLCVGLGQRGNTTQAGGYGLVHFDDIGIEPFQGYDRSDFDLDGSVSYEDLRIMVDHWLLAGQAPTDLSGDNKVNMMDFAILAGRWSR